MDVVTGADGAFVVAGVEPAAARVIEVDGTLAAPAAPSLIARPSEPRLGRRGCVVRPGVPMRHVPRAASLVLVFSLACSPSEPSGGGAAGTSGGAGTSGTAGTGSAGTSAAAGTSGSAGTGGGAGTASTAGTGGTTMPDGGAPDVRDAKDPSDAPPATGDGGRAPKASAGCGKANPPTGARTLTTGGQTGMFNVKLPAGYSATTPVPLGLGFHGFNNPACGPTSGECRGFADLPAVTVYMKSFSQGWEQAAVLEQNVTYFQDVVALMKNEYCIDENRIFIAGVSSGGQFVEHLTCRFGDWLWQVTPVSASVVNGQNTGCKGTPPILVIHGVTDQAGNYGQGVAEKYARRNGCSATAPAGLAKAKADMMTAFNAMRAEHVCLDWDGCTANPVRFCISSQITYDGLTHGWPKVGGMLIGDFLSKLP
jgi:poly(3-hydroxybutyrate) depolymerase